MKVKAEFISGLAITWLGTRQVESGCIKMWQNGGKQIAESIKNKVINIFTKIVK